MAKRCGSGRCGPRPPKDEDDVCKVTGQPHVPDWKSVSVEQDGDETYIDINCRDCGRSGCIGTQATLADEITW